MFDAIIDVSVTSSARLLPVNKTEVSGIKVRPPHINHDHAIVEQFGFNEASQGFDSNLSFCTQTLLVDKANKASRTIAALLNLCTVGIKDAVAEIVARILWPFNNKDLVGAYPKMSIGDLPPINLFDVNRLADRIDDNKIVTCTLHFAKANHHGTE
jgi:hypothetical protein